MTSSAFSATDEEKSCAENGINYQHATSLVSEIKTAVQADDKKALANLMDYPVRVNRDRKDGGNSKIKNAAGFVKQYDKLFTVARKKAVLDNKEIFCNYQGGMIAGGFLWFRDGKDRAKVFVING